MGLANLTLNFDQAEIAVFFEPFYAFLEKMIIGIILILPAIFLLKLVLKRRWQK